MQAPQQRVAPVVAPKEWLLPERPAAPPQAVDAYRQTEFGLRTDLRLLHEGMNLQLRVVADSYPAAHRSHPAAAFELYWSRVFHALSDAASLITRGSYVSVPALARAACECFAAAVQLGADEHAMYLSFLSHALKPDAEQHAIEIGRGSYLAGGTLAAIPPLGAVFRTSSELARPNIGATLIEVAPESNQQRIAVLFGDQAFHYGWAQLELGWLLTLCGVVLDAAGVPGSPLHVEAETQQAIDTFLPKLAEAITDSPRCRVEEIEQHGERRLLIHNFRRQSGGAPHRMLL